jgi:hypothetical protein
MDRREINDLINAALKVCNDSITTDWLAYCLHQSVDIEVLGNETFIEKLSIKSGVPAVDTLKIYDNDFFNCQCEDFKKKFVILDQPEFAICIERIKDIQILDSENINVVKNQVFLKFRNPT